MMIDVEFANSAAMRQSLARGLATEAMQQAAQDEAPGARIFEELATMRPNVKSRTRNLMRLKRRSGVVRACLTGGDATPVVVFRNTRQVEYRIDGDVLFSETALIYTRVLAVPDGNRSGYMIHRLGLCRHALERYVVRTNCPLRDLQAQIDAEAVRAIAQIAGGMVSRDADDEYLTSRQGVWAGGLDHTDLEPDWGLISRAPEMAISLFSVRTFLGEDQMRPALWFRLYGQDGAAGRE